MAGVPRPTAASVWACSVTERMSVEAEHARAVNPPFAAAGRLHPEPQSRAFTKVNDLARERCGPRLGAERRAAPAATDEAQPRVSVRGLDAWFGSSHVVRDVNVDFFDGDVTAIIGPSGCGKSTLLRCLNRMHETVPSADFGHVIGDGYLVLTYSPSLPAPDLDQLRAFVATPRKTVGGAIPGQGEPVSQGTGQRELGHDRHPRRPPGRRRDMMSVPPPSRSSEPLPSVSRATRYHHGSLSRCSPEEQRG